MHILSPMRQGIRPMSMLQSDFTSGIRIIAVKAVVINQFIEYHLQFR